MEMKGGIFEMDNRIIFSLVTIAILVLGGYLYYDAGAIVSAQGNAQIKAMPDEVLVYLNIQARNSSAEVAQSMQNEVSDELITQLIKIGLERKDIQTLSINVYEEFDWANNVRVSKGYISSHQIVVKTSNFERLGFIVDKSIQSGALISGINFELSQEKQNEYKQEALRNAGADAKAKAQATAEGLGKRIGRLVSVESQDFYYYPRVLYSGEGIDMVADNAHVKKVVANISPRDIDVSATIQVRYKLGLF